MPFDCTKINYLAVLVAGLINFFVGALWYTVLFGKLWIQLNGFSEQQIKEMQAKMSPPRFFGGQILSQLVLAVAVAMLLTGFAEITVSTGLTVGVLVWVASAAISATIHIASDR